MFRIIVPITFYTPISHAKKWTCASLFLSLLFSFTSQQECTAQELQNISQHSDCTTAFALGTDTSFGPTTPPKGVGNRYEIKNQSPKSLYSFTREHHTVWYTFEAASTGTLTFDIIPEDSTNDYDFLLFKGTPEELCEAIVNNEVKPIRSNISRFNPSIGSKTGLSAAGTASFVHSGPGDDYSKALEVKKGEKYLLVVDNVYPNGKGHELAFHYTSNSALSTNSNQTKPKEKKVEKPVEVVVEKTESEDEVRNDSNRINELPNEESVTTSEKDEKPKVVHLYDAPEVAPTLNDRVRKLIPIEGMISGRGKEGISAVVTCTDRITGELLASTPTNLDGTYEMNIPVVKGVREYRLEIFADGYFFTDTLFTLRDLTKIAQQGISRELQPLEVGATFRVNNINFYGDSPEPLPESIYIYKNLLQIMAAYENMRIKVEGHTNGCYGGIISSTRLSVARATSVRNYLGKNGINPERIEIKGWGCSKMLYPNPADDNEARLNRRVEIKVLAL